MLGLRQLLTIASIGLLVAAAHLFCMNYELAKRVFSVQPTPSVVTYRQLMEHGTPPSNRYVQVMNSWVGTRPSGKLNADTNEWEYGVLPVFETRARREGDGRNVRLLAIFPDTPNAGQLKRRALTRDIKGCVWADSIIDDSVKESIHRSYPGIDFGKCRILNVGDPPSAVELQKQQHIVFGLLGGGVLAAILSMVFGFSQRMRVRKFCQDSNPYTSKFGSDAKVALKDDSQRSFKEVIVTKFLPLVAGLSYVGYLFVKVGFLSTGAALGLGVFSLVGIVGLAILSACNRTRHRELSYDILCEENLKLSNRWQELTNELEQMGFERSLDVKCKGIGSAVPRRVFCSVNNKHMAVIEGNGRSPILWFATICTDGALIKSSTGPKPNTHAAVPLRFNTMGSDLKEEVQKHLGIVQACKEVRFVDPVTVHPDGLIGFLDYHHRLGGWLEHKNFRLVVPPAALPTPNDFMRTNDRMQEKYFGWTAPRSAGSFQAPPPVGV